MNEYQPKHNNPKDLELNGELYRFYGDHGRIGPHIAKASVSVNGYDGWKVWKKFESREELDNAWDELSAQSAKSADKKEPITPELLPPDSKTKSISFLPESDRVVQYHLAAERCANLSVWCAAMAGAEILKKKKELGHGNGFQGWKKSLPFSAKTAENYMSLAKQLEQRLNALPEENRKLMLPALAEAQDNTQNMLELLNLPSPMDVFNPAHEQIAEIIRDVTSGKTITQLYFDWEICKPPRQLGGNPTLQKWLAENHPRVKATRPDDLSDKLRKEYEAHIETLNQQAQQELSGMDEKSIYHRQATAKWNEINDLVYAFKVNKTYAAMPRHEIQAIADFLGDFVFELKAALKG